MSEVGNLVGESVGIMENNQACCLGVWTHGSPRILEALRPYFQCNKVSSCFTTFSSSLSSIRRWYKSMLKPGHGSDSNVTQIAKIEARIRISVLQVHSYVRTHENK